MSAQKGHLERVESPHVASPGPRPDETADAWTDRLAREGAALGVRRQCSIGWHGECSARHDGADAECRCDCHGGRPDRLIASGCDVAYGCRVTYSGEEDEHLILGHVPARRAVAVLRAYGRSQGYDTGWMGETFEDACAPLVHTWLAVDKTPADPDALWSGQFVREGTPGAIAVTSWDPNR